MNTKPFRWLWTALVTPFQDGNGIDNPIDYEALTRLLDMQIEGWVDGVLLLGTTGENPTLTKEESLALVTFAVQKLVWHTKIMVNIGNNSTHSSLENLQSFEEIWWIDAYLVVNPYYNKPTQTGLALHFTTIANATRKPVVLYNIQWRTGVNLETNTLLEILSLSSNVIWVKEASGNMAQMKELIEKRPKDFLVFSGDDALTYELSQNGGDGVISVASNCIPARMKSFVDACLNHEENAWKKGEQLREFFDALFFQTNPLPTKTYLAEKWIILENFRLPMCPMDAEKRQVLLEVMTQYASE